MSFVSASTGWVLGASGCAECTALRETRDRGGIWTVLPPPPAPLGYYTSGGLSGVTQVAFAGAASGFLYGPDLLATSDGGRTWSREPLPPVQDLVTGNGYAYALTSAATGAPDRLWRTAIDKLAVAPRSYKRRTACPAHSQAPTGRAAPRR